MQAVIEVTDAKFDHYWSELFANDPVQNPFYSQQASRCLQPDSTAAVFTDRSFVVVARDEPVFACSLTMHTDANGRTCLGYFGLEASTHVNRQSLEPRSNNFQVEAVQLLQQHIATLIDEIQPHSLEYLDPVSCGMMSPVTQVLLEKGARPIVQTAKIIDLTLSEHALRRKLRQSQRGKISWGLSNLSIELITGSQFDDGASKALVTIFNDAMASGTSPYSSLASYQQLLREQKAFLVQGLSAEHGEATALFVHTERTCHFVFGSGTNPDRPMLPALIWTALLHCKHLGCTRFEMGRMAHASVENTERSKLLNSFGGDSQTRLKVCLVA